MIVSRFGWLVLGVLVAAGPSRAGDQEVAPPTEAANTAKVVAIIEAAIGAVFKGGDRPSRRDAHAKGHGCVKAIFKVRDDLPRALRHGVFATPRTFIAWIRFSNSSGSPHPDYEGDARGMAIKLTGVAGAKLLDEEHAATTQDFVMINYPVFFIRNVADYLPFVTMVLEGKIQAFFATHQTEGQLFAAFNATPVDNMLTQRFYSGSPYRVGGAYVKFSAIPVDCATGARIVDIAGAPTNAAGDYLRLAMVGWLRAKDACFSFALQPQVDPAKQPIEDTTVLWNEADAPFVDVAAIRIPKQDFDTTAQQTFCENLSYTPWHTVPEQRPVGGINRMRRSVYMAISKLRHRLNTAPRAEPTGQETF